MARWLKALSAIVLAVIVVGAGWVGWRLYDRDPEIRAADVSPKPELIARGKYLTEAADCAACHTTGNGRPFAGGLPFKLPFGTIYSTNITSDKETGIGNWSDDDFVRALHQGVAPGGRYLYPAFPYTSYTKMSRDDAVAIKAYLFSLTPVDQPPTPNTLPFPFNKRWGMFFWNLAFLDQHRFRPESGQSELQSRGAYFATALGHCGECHTPRNLAFAMKSNELHAGAELEGWRAYNITSDRTYGIGDWTDDQLASYLTKGHAEGRGAPGGPMAEVVAKSLRFLTENDIKALVAYLRSVPPRPGIAGAEVNPRPVAMAHSVVWTPAKGSPAGMGLKVFEGACASCHEWSGGGRQTPFASLQGSRAANDPDGSNVMQTILFGTDLRAVTPLAFMPAFGQSYSDAEIAAVSNYVIAQFGGKAGKVTPEMVAKARLQGPPH